MEVVLRNEQFNESWFSGFRTILEKSFIKVNHKVNAEFIFQEMKFLDVDKKQIISKIKNLSEEEWSSDYFVKTLKDLDGMIGVSDEFLKKHAIEELRTYDLVEIKWEIMKRMVIDYAKFSKEFYDSLKYSQNSKLDRERRLLMLNLMEALNQIYDSSKSLVDKYNNKNYNKNSFKKFMNVRFGIEHLLLRIYFILFNIENSKKIKKYRYVLSSELVEFTIKQTR